MTPIYFVLAIAVAMLVIWFLNGQSYSLESTTAEEDAATAKLAKDVSTTAKKVATAVVDEKHKVEEAAKLVAAKLLAAKVAAEKVIADKASAVADKIAIEAKKVADKLAADKKKLTPVVAVAPSIATAIPPPVAPVAVPASKVTFRAPHLAATDAHHDAQPDAECTDSRLCGTGAVRSVKQRTSYQRKQ